MHISHLVSFLHAAVLLYRCNASPVTPRSSYEVKERHTVPRDWIEVGSAPGREIISLQIGLKQSNEGLIEQHLLQVSDPSHARYGRHLTSAEIERIITPSDVTVKLVQIWLRENNITDFTSNPTGDWIFVPSISIKDAEKLLQTKYSVFAHKHDGTSIMRTPEWSLPAHLHQHIDVVQPTTSFFRPSKRSKLEKRSTDVILDGGEEHDVSWWERYGKAHYAGQGGIADSNISSICNITFTTLQCLRTLYGTIDYVPKSADKNWIGFTAYLNETARRADVELFLETFRPDAVSAAQSYAIINIANAPDNQGVVTPEEQAIGTYIEGDLDGELVVGLTYPTRVTAFLTGGSPPWVPDLNTPSNTNEPYLTWLNYVLAQDDLPYVISTSYGDDEQTVPYSYAKRVCAGLAQLGARGISVIFSSGDFGVGFNGTCISNVDNSTMFTPEFPTSCPWVTSVGGTQGFEPEVAVQRFGSGAGFSNYFGAPGYQVEAVNAYIAGLDGLYDGLYNKSGRGYPDVAAQGNHDAIAWDGIIRTIGGTSASSPTFASVISLVNDALLAANKPVLGFLNPWIYGGAYKALTDITSGSSIGCNVTGFPATKGWDAVTGFGTPNFKKLVEFAFEKYGGC